MRRRRGAIVLPMLMASVLVPAALGAGTAQAASDSTQAALPLEPEAAPGSALSPRGIIVKTTSSSVSVMGLAAASEVAISAVADAPVNVSVGSAVAPATRVLFFDQPVSEADAEAAARALERRPDVAWAVPDRPMHISATPLSTPVIPNDPKFGQQWDLWDASASNGGYSVKAPMVWGTTTGSASVVVAIVDTGITNHPDLNANVVPGYDFISDVDVANDGNERDPDPSDPGDWITSNEAAFGYFQGCDVSESSWHGTHVAGTVSAVQDNGIGISGIAPGVRIQSVRTLGKCGGYTADIVAGVRWAVGGHISGVPDNPTPAKVVNLSLGGAGECSPAEQEVVDFVRSQGAVMVVAAGNEGQPVTTSSPANCNGVIAVAATGRDGEMASYSNYGTSAGEVTLAAPGGNSPNDAGILSTVNNGTTSPTTPGYSAYDGTSMATPHVAAAAALLYSMGVSGSAAIRAALIDAVQRFPSGVAHPCTTTKCGAGILDLSKLSSGAPATAPGAPTGVQATGADSSVVVSWTAPASDGGAAISSYTATAEPGGGACTTAALTCTITQLTNDTPYTVTVTATNTAGLTSVASAGVVATPSATPSTVPGAVSNVRVSWVERRTSYTAILRWSAPAQTGGSPIDGYRARLARVGGSYGSWETITQASIRAIGLRAGVRYRVQIQAHNASGYGTSYVQRLQP